jgi:chromosome segregation ATPase
VNRRELGRYFAEIRKGDNQDAVDSMMAILDEYDKLQSEHKELKEDFDTAYKELQGERKRADELQEQLERLKQQSMVLSESRYELADEAELLQDQLRRKDEQIAKFTESQARVQARLKGQKDRAKRRVHRLEAQIKKLNQAGSLLAAQAVNRDAQLKECVDMLESVVLALEPPLGVPYSDVYQECLDLLNKLKRGG